MSFSNEFSYKTFGVTRTEGVTNNGLRIVLYHRKNMPLSMELMFRNGALNDPIGKEGLAHFTEHMIVAGTKRFPTKDKLSMYIENTGSSYSAYTNQEVIGLEFELADESDLDILVDFVNDILTNSLFADKTVKNERKAIYQEIGDKFSSPARYQGVLNHKLYYQNTRFERLTIGTRKSVSSISKKDLMDYYETMFTTSRAVLVVSGDTSIERLVSTFNNLGIKKGRKVNFDNSVMPETRKQYFSYKKFKGVNQIRFTFGFRICPATDPDYYPLCFIDEALGNGRSSVLSRKLRLDNGLVYSCYSRYGAGFDGGTFTSGASTHKSNLQKVVDIIINEFRRIKSGDFVDEVDLEFLKNKILKSRRRLMQTSSRWVSSHSYLDLFNIPDLDNFPMVLNKLNAVTKADIERVSKKYFDSDTWYFAMVGDISKKDIKIKY